jgi:hypothetical protein
MRASFTKVLLAALARVEEVEELDWACVGAVGPLS